MLCAKGCFILFAVLLTAATVVSAEVRVMSLNIRYSTPNDLQDAWPLRRELCFGTIETFDPDLMGLQEVLLSQADEIKARFKSHEFVGVPRVDGKTKGEIAPILFRRDRFERVEQGHFWLSETPQVVGSKGWDADLPRIVTWAKLRDKRGGDRLLLVLNTHWDHKGAKAREESAKLMRRRMAELSEGAMPVIVTGDFNIGPDSSAYREMLGGEEAKPRLIDTFVEKYSTATTRQSFTFHGFTGQSKDDRRIDWVLHSPEFRTRDAGIDRTNQSGRYPSDHFPVTAVVEWRETVKR
jgi:endonuclease/exonuclease/phosphatase family metal-dependent hydrolase